MPNIFITISMEGPMSEEEKVPEHKAMIDVRLAVTYDPALLRRLWTYTAAVDTEISGIGEVRIDGQNFHLPDDMHMLKQEGHIAGTHLDVSKVADLVHDFIKAGKTPKKLKFWYHTHPGIGRDAVYFSGTDTATIAKLNRDFGDPWIAGVFSRDGWSHWGISRQGTMIYEWDYMIPGTVPTEQELEQAEEFLKPLVQEWNFRSSSRRVLRRMGFRRHGW